MTKKLLGHWPFILLILTLGVYLGVKAVPENSWDGWRVGSAQTLLSDKQWAEDGILNNYFLFLPQGYSKTVRYFDDPELRQHSRGIATGGFIGKRLYYTHYPFSYLLPTALLMKFGVENRFWLRLLEILFSLGGLAFLYWFLNIVSNRLAALAGALFYGASTIFLDYADSLANQPLDDLWRFAAIALSVFSLSASEKNKKYLNYGVWSLFFLASISSYDSTLFILAWLVGLDLLILKKINFKKWLFWSSAPALAFGVQIFQNYLYLGWHNMILDFYGAFKVGILGSRDNFFISHFKRLIEPFGWFFGVQWYLGIIISFLGIWCLKIIKKYSGEILNIRYLYLTLIAILSHFLFFPSLFFYQGRLIAVFAALLMGSLTVFSFKTLFRQELKINARIVFAIILIAILGLWLIQTNRTYAYIKNWPNNIWPQENINFDKKIKNLVAGDKVIFQISKRGAASEDEYYTGAPILEFTNIKDLARDYNYLKNRSEFPFSAIIISDEKENLNAIQKNLGLKKDITEIDNKFVIVIPE